MGAFPSLNLRPQLDIPAETETVKFEKYYE